MFEDNFQQFHSCKKHTLVGTSQISPPALKKKNLTIFLEGAESNAFRNPLAVVERILCVAQSHAARGPQVHVVVALRRGFVGHPEPLAENTFHVDVKSGQVRLSNAAVANSQVAINKDLDSSRTGESEFCSTVAWTPLREPDCEHFAEGQSSARETVASKLEHLHSVALLAPDVKAGFDRACRDLTFVTQLTDKTEQNDLRNLVQDLAAQFEWQDCPLVVVSALYFLRERLGAEQVGMLLEGEMAALYR